MAQTFTKALFESYALQPENLSDIKEAINRTVYKDEDFTKFVNLVSGVKDNDPIALLGDIDAVGKKGGGCDPQYEEKGIGNSLKRWKLGSWEIPIKICYDSMKGTIAEYSLNKGTDIGDLTNTDIMTIYAEKLKEAIMRMRWRQAWLGDENAQHVTDGGKITDTVPVDLFSTNDGLFKRIFEQGTANTAQVTAITANTKTSPAEQRKAALTKGYMTDLVDTILMDADTRIVDDPNAVLMLTRSMADALAYDIKKSYNVIMPWEKVFDGFEVANYGGVKVARVGIWDRMLNAYEKSSTVVNKPYRAVFANPKQLMVGCPKDVVSDLDIFFDRKERRNYIYATGKVGTALLEEDMFHAAY